MDKEPIEIGTTFGKDFFVGWETFHNEARLLASNITELWPEIDGIVAVTRGGLIPAAIIARELNIRLIETLCMEMYHGFESGDPTVFKEPTTFMSDGGKNKLIIDDLVDKGGTMRKAELILPNSKKATVYAKPTGMKMTDIFVTRIPQDTWIHFPWDLEPARRKPLRGDDS